MQRIIFLLIVKLLQYIVYGLQCIWLCILPSPCTGPRDLPNVLRALTDIKYRWEFLAVQFGLPRQIIESAWDNYPQDPNGCLMYVLAQWLKGNSDSEHFGHPSWRRVCEVTAEPAGGDNKALARKIAATDVKFIG